MLTVVLLSVLAADPVVTITPLDDEAYAETYSWMADLDDGTYVLAQMAVSNLGPGDRNAACRAIVVRADRTTISEGKMYDDDEWTLTEGVLRIGPCRFDVDRGAKMHIEAEGLTIDLETKTPLSSRRPLNATAKTTSGSYAVEILATQHDLIVRLAIGGGAPKAAIPASGVRRDRRSRARYRLVHGQTRETIRGRGFMNHSRANVLPAKVARRWIRFRSVRSAEPTIVHARIPSNGGAKGFVLEGHQAEHDVTGAKIAYRGEGARRAFRARVETKAGRLRLTTVGPALYRDAPLEKYGWLGALLGRLLGNPVTFTYRAQLDQKGASPIDGIAEFALID